MSSLFNVEPDDVRRIKDEFGRLMDGAMDRVRTVLRQSPDVDILQNAEELLVRIDLPGYDESRIHLEVSGQELTIDVDQANANQGTHVPYRLERRQGALHRVITLPVEVESSATRAIYHHGLLEVHLPKIPGAKRHSVPIDAQPMPPSAQR